LKNKQSELNFSENRLFLLTKNCEEQPTLAETEMFRRERFKNGFEENRKQPAA